MKCTQIISTNVHNPESFGLVFDAYANEPVTDNEEKTEARAGSLAVLLRDSRCSPCTRKAMRLAGVRALCLSTWGFVAAAAFPATPPSHFHLPGDYILGGLFSLHAEVVGKPVLNRSLVPTCKA